MKSKFIVKEIKKCKNYIITLPEIFGIDCKYIISCTTPTVLYNGVIDLYTCFPIIVNNFYPIIPQKKPIKFDMNIDFLTDDAHSIGNFELKGCEIIEIKNSDLNHYSTDNLTGKIKIKYSKCIPNTDCIKIDKLYKY